MLNTEMVHNSQNTESPLCNRNSFPACLQLNPLTSRWYLQALAQIPESCNWPFSSLYVITSYSIHYTKLYELCMADQRTLLGTVTREELLNLQLSSINAKLELETAASRLTEANSALAIFLGFPSTVVLQCKVPTVIAPIALDPGNVLDYACKANPQIDKIALLQMSFNFV